MDNVLNPHVLTVFEMVGRPIQIVVGHPLNVVAAAMEVAVRSMKTVKSTLREDQRCVPADCQDGIQNLDETDIDCGDPFDETVPPAPIPPVQSRH